MRLLIYPHAMEIGGSQLNAIELASAVRNRGHDVLVVSGPGPLVETVRDLGLTHVPAPMGRSLYPRLPQFLTRLVDERHIDVVHGYEWPPAMALYLGPHIMRRVPVVCTVMSMAVAPFLPRHIPMIVGTEDILLRARAAGHDATLLEPPVDTLANAPGIDSSRFRSSLAVDPDCLLIVVVGRISKELKLEGLLSACDAISALAARGVGVRLAVVGAGGASDLVAERARRANALAGREVVTLVGSMADPRPAYAAADVLLGMGGSALRGMAFAKPLIVQGELGFWRLCTPETAASFLKGGWYGLGDIEFPLTEAGHANSASRLILELEPLIFDARYREELGRFGRELVVGRFSLDRATAIQERVYEEAVKNKRGAHVLDAARSVSGAAIHTVRQRLLRKLNLGSSEDFNTVLAQKGRPR